MIWYVIKLLVMLALICGLAWGSLRLLKRMQEKMGAADGSTRSLKIVESMMLSPGQRLAVVEFRGRAILFASTRNGLTLLSDQPLDNAEGDQ